MSHPLHLSEPDRAADLFTHDVAPDRPAPTLTREFLGMPQIVKYVGLRRIPISRDGKDQLSSKHLFQSQAGTGPWFSVWGSVDLDSQLRQLRAGAVFQLRYAGEVSEGENRTRHKWEVKTTTATADQIARLRQEGEWIRREQALLQNLASIEADIAAKREARNRGEQAPGDGAAVSGDDDDDGLPF